MITPLSAASRRHAMMPLIAAATDAIDYYALPADTF